LDEITALLELWDLDQCAPVQERLRTLVLSKQRDLAEQIADLESFRRELARVADRLGLPAQNGACNDSCGCLTDDPTEVPVSLARHPARDGPLPACQLGPADYPGRVAAWQQLVAGAVERDETADGLLLRFDETVSVGEVADLASKERDCCSFFDFTIHVA